MTATGVEKKLACLLCVLRAMTGRREGDLVILVNGSRQVPSMGARVRVRGRAERQPKHCLCRVGGWVCLACSALSFSVCSGYCKVRQTGNPDRDRAAASCQFGMAGWPPPLVPRLHGLGLWLSPLNSVDSRREKLEKMGGQGGRRVCGQPKVDLGAVIGTDSCCYAVPTTRLCAATRQAVTWRHSRSQPASQPASQPNPTYEHQIYQQRKRHAVHTQDRQTKRSPPRRPFASRQQKQRITRSARFKLTSGFWQLGVNERNRPVLQTTADSVDRSTEERKRDMEGKVL